MSKVLESAVANATHNFDLPEERLYVYRAFVDEGIRIKRWMPRAYGRANRIHKPTAHITVIVRAKDIEEEPLMGQKINPYGFRLGITTDWKAQVVRRRERSTRRTCTRTSRSATTSARSSRTG